ncbi:MAG TPA: phage holin family protein [Actinomycetota bacterium]|nr:phage holin family protein [Actinomycetota bacterium]
MSAQGMDSGSSSGVQAQRPLGTVMASAIDGVRTLFRQQVELAKIEATEAAATYGTGAGIMGAAAVLGKYAIIFGAASAAAALSLVMPVWAAILIMAALLALVAGVLVLVGRRTLRTAPTPGERTREVLKENGQWARRQIAR